jgi:DNA-directed RNA polymerase specialized sigma24 family protein
MSGHGEIDASRVRLVRHSMRALADAALVVEMRSGDEMAFREFILRFEGQLDQHARRLGFAAAERRTIVAETLDDAALALIAPGRRIPRSLPAYLVTSLRNRIRNDRRSGARMHVREARVDGNSTYGDDKPLACSEGTLRASAGMSWEAQPAPSAAADFALALVNELSDDELQLLVWVSHHVPYRDIAAWFGIGYAAVGKRVERLRGRMRARDAVILATLGARERAAIESLIARGAIPGRLEPLPSQVARSPVHPVPREGASR